MLFVLYMLYAEAYLSKTLETLFTTLILEVLRFGMYVCVRACVCMYVCMYVFFKL
jgi:hypothetical protein